MSPERLSRMDSTIEATSLVSTVDGDRDWTASSLRARSPSSADFIAGAPGGDGLRCICKTFSPSVVEIPLTGSGFGRGLRGTVDLGVPVAALRQGLGHRPRLGGVHGGEDGRGVPLLHM